jgi:hypothetical protein
MSNTTHVSHMHSHGNHLTGQQGDELAHDVLTELLDTLPQQTARYVEECLVEECLVAVRAAMHMLASQAHHAADSQGMPSLRTAADECGTPARMSSAAFLRLLRSDWF